MKHKVIILICGMLHIIPILCVAIMAMNPTETVRAITTSVLLGSTLALGYWHGHERTFSAPVRKTIKL